MGDKASTRTAKHPHAAPGLMRAVATTMLMLAMTLSGCLSGGGDDPEPLDGADARPGDSWTDPHFDWTGLDRTFPYDAMNQYCLDEANCTYWDGRFHEGTVYELDTTVLDAVVMPVPGVLPTGATAAAGQATAAWTLVEQFAADWFVDAWELNTHVVGSGAPGTDFVTDPEIVVVSEGVQRSTSIGLNAEQLACGIAGVVPTEAESEAFVPGSIATRVYPVHEHDGMAIFAAECITGGFRCAALNFASALSGNNGLYDLVAHEVGHCLGLSHVGDALDFNARFVPEADIMAYADNPSRVSCASNLNARVMEGIYAELAGQERPAWMDDVDHMGMDPWDYETAECPLPTSGPL